MLVLVAKLIERLDAVLQRPDVLETGIRRRNHLVGSRIDRVGEVQSPEAAGHRHTVQARLDHGIEVLVGLGGIAHAAVLTVRAFGIHLFGVGGNGVGGDVTHDVQYAVIVVQGILVVLGCLVIFVLVSVVTLFEVHDALHQRTVLHLESYLGNVSIEICHTLYIFLIYFYLLFFL